MYMNDAGLENTRQWEEAGFTLPAFNRRQVRQNTLLAPEWVHFGAGNIFRAFPAMLQQQLLNAGEAQTGIVVAEGYDYEILDLVNEPYNNLSLLVTLKANGEMQKTIVGSVVQALKADTHKEDWEQLKAIFANPSLQMASFTITEKGYGLHAANGSTLPQVQQDFENGPFKPESYIGKLAAFCHHRFACGGAPLALVSMDNCAHNGTRLFEAVLPFAQQWAEKKLAEPGFLEYITNPQRISFPCSMIDKITPRPDEGVKEALLALGFEGANGQVTKKNTYVAPFVNAEETQYLVVEDVFPNGRPPLEKAGVLFTTRSTVDKVEKMKVGTCLNPLHTALAVFGCLLGYAKISDEMQDELLVRLIKRIGYQEGLPVAVSPGILSPKEFMDTVINVRFPNPFIPDTPQRIATDTSQKLSVRFGETIKAYVENPALDVQRLVGIPLVLAGWCRYVLGIRDDSEFFEVSPDPMLAELQHLLSGVTLGANQNWHELLAPILSNQNIFGVNLYTAGLGQRVEGYFAQMVAGQGAVRSTLETHLQNVT